MKFSKFTVVKFNRSVGWQGSGDESQSQSDVSRPNEVCYVPPGNAYLVIYLTMCARAWPSTDKRSVSMSGGAARTTTKTQSFRKSSSSNRLEIPYDFSGLSRGKWRIAIVLTEVL
jgi:hypothetical protein